MQSIIHQTSIRLCTILFFILMGLHGYTQNTTYRWDGSSGTAWNNASNWTVIAGTGTTFPGNGGTGDIVEIPAVTNQPTLSTALANAVASVTFTGSATLTITGQTLIITGALTINNLANASLTAGITGTGTINCASFTAGGTTTLTGNNTTTTVNLSLSTLTISGSITIRSRRNNGSTRNNVTVNHNSGTVTTANITTQNTGTPTSAFIMGNTNPRLNITGNTPFSLAGTGANSFTLNGTGATVDYQSSSNVSLPTATGLTAYRNLIISGGNGNIKTAGSALTLTGTLTVAAASTLALGTNTLATPLGITLETVGGGNGASITGTTGNISLGGNITIDYTGTGSIVSGASITKNIALGAANRTITVEDDGNNNEDCSITGVISGNAGIGIIKSGNGALGLQAANSYTGTTTISAGTLLVNNNVAVSTSGPLGNANTAIILGDAATTTNNSSPSLLINGAFSVARTISIANQATTGIYSIGGNTDNNASFTGLITFSRPFSVLQVATTSTNELSITGGITGGLAGTKIIRFDNIGTVEMNTSAITDGTGTTSVEKHSAGTLIMSIANSFTGGTGLYAGRLNINNSGALGTVAGTFTVAGGVIGNTSGAAITTLNYPMAWNSDFTFSGPDNIHLGTATVTMSGSRGITVSSGTTLTVGGTINHATFSITKTGAGTLAFVNQTITLASLSINGGTVTATSGTMNLAGTLTNNASFVNNNGTVNMNNAASSIVNNSTLVFNNLTIAATPSSQAQYNTSFTVAGTIATSGAANFSPSGGAITMSGASGIISNTTGTMQFNQLNITGTIGSTGSFTVSNTMNVTGEMNPNASTVIGGSGTLTGTGTVKVTRLLAVPGFGAQYSIANKTLIDLIVDYTGAGAQTVTAADYGTLVISINGTRTVTLENGGIIRVAKVFTPAASSTTYIVTNNSFEYNGSSTQTITAFSYHHLIISNSGNKQILASSTVICQTFTSNDATVDIPDTAILEVQG